mgnify:CR=1 FL=1
MTRADTLSFIAMVDNQHTLRLLANGKLGLLRDPKNRKGKHRSVEVLAQADATRVRAVELALRIHRDARKLTPGFLKAVQTRLGETEVQSLDIAAAHYAAA